jgi:sugar phosphate isomerase/epimerase
MTADRNELALAPTSLPNTPPLEFIAAARAAGYQSIGLRLHRSPAYPNWFPIVGDTALMRDVQHALADAGVRLLDIFTFYLQPETDLDVMAAAMEFGATLGGRYAQLIGDDDDWSRMTANYARFCDIAAGFNLVAAIEAPVNSRKVNSVPMAAKLIADAARPNSAIVLDPLQFFRSGDGIDVLREHTGLIAYTQFNDGPSAGPRTEPGHGEVPLAEILNALADGVPISVEWSEPAAADHRAATPATEWAACTYASTQRFLDGYYTGSARA